MSTKGGLIFLITSIILVLCCIVGLIGVYYFDWLKPANSGYTLYTATSDNDARFVIKDEADNTAQPAQSAKDVVLGSTTLPPAQTDTPAKTATPDTTVAQNETTPAETEANTPVISVGNPEKKYSYLNPTAKPDTSSSPNNQSAVKTSTSTTISVQNAAKTEPQSKQPQQTTVAAKKDVSTPVSAHSSVRTSSGNPVAPSAKYPAPKFTKSEPVGKDGSPIKIGFTFDKNRDFHSYGQYVSADEYKYRLAVINNLKIKTIVIDAVSQGNGISQEYYKVAYNANMIPAKILDEIVTSKEFRSLIPKQYLDIEEKMTSFPKGGKVTFNNTDMKELLILWSQGKLTPTQKAWQVKAAM